MTNDLTTITEGIKTFFEAQTIANITKKLYHPAIEAITTLNAGSFILSYDSVNYNDFTLTQNDRLDLIANIDIIVSQGKLFETIDSLLAVIKANNSLNRIVLKTTVENIDLNNPSAKLEGSTIKIVFSI